MWIMSVLFIVKVTLWFHHITSAATHVTAYGLRVIQSSEFTKSAILLARLCTNCEEKHSYTHRDTSARLHGG